MKIFKTLNEYYFDIVLFYSIISCFYFLNYVNIYDEDLYAKSLFLILGNIGLLVYSHVFSKLHDKKEDSVNGRMIIRDEKNYWLYTSVFFTLSSALFYIYVNNFTLIIVWTICFLMSTLYSFPKKYRFKSVFILKNFTPALLWFLTLTNIIFLQNTSVGYLALIGSTFNIFFIFFMFELLWDIPDKEGDLKSGVKTFPVVFGVNRTKLFIISIGTILFFLTNFWVLKTVILMIIIFAALVKEGKDKTLYHFLLYVLGSLYLAYLIFRFFA